MPATGQACRDSAHAPAGGPSALPPAVRRGQRRGRAIHQPLDHLGGRGTRPKVPGALRDRAEDSPHDPLRRLVLPRRLQVRRCLAAAGSIAGSGHAMGARITSHLPPPDRPHFIRAAGRQDQMGKDQIGRLLRCGGAASVELRGARRRRGHQDAGAAGDDRAADGRRGVGPPGRAGDRRREPPTARDQPLP